MTHLERTTTGPVFAHGHLVTASEGRIPLTLSHDDWEALEAVFAEPARIMELREAALRRVVEMHNDYVKTLLRERDTAERERDVMRPVVEAARAWRGTGPWVSGSDVEYRLFAAVDALDGAS